MRAPLAILVLTACGRLGFDAVAITGAPVPMYWGDYAATLPVRACTGATLVVNDTTDSLDGGMTITDASQAGPTLSFIEAIWIAQNRGGSNVITFDPSVFPVDAPATIDVGEVQLPMNPAGNTCIDGRSRGVIVDWAGCSSPLCPPGVFRGSLLVGVTYLHPSFELTVSIDSQVAGCRIATDGTNELTGMRFWTMELHDGATIGPGNSIAGYLTLRVFANGTADITVRDNGIGYDPVTELVVPTTDGLDFFPGNPTNITIANNVFAVQGQVDSEDPFELLGYTPVFTGNFVGVDRTRTPLGPGLAGFVHNGFGPITIGPDNDIENVAVAINASGSGATITRNRITANGAGIAYVNPPAPPPAVATATRTQITGTCAPSATVEVFADGDDEGALYLATTLCDGTGAFAVTGTFPGGSFATATQTVAGGTSAFSPPLLIQ